MSLVFFLLCHVFYNKWYQSTEFETTDATQEDQSPLLGRHLRDIVEASRGGGTCAASRRHSTAASARQRQHLDDIKDGPKISHNSCDRD